MAKELLLVRHGITEAPGFDKKDLKRDLIQPGIDQLERLSKLLKANGQVCDHMVYSPANRCRQTAQILSSAVGVSKSTVVNEIYQAGHGDLLQVLNNIDNGDAHVMMVGHNPGVSHLAAFLTGEDHLLFSPGMMVRIAFYLEEWQHISKSSGVLVEVLQ
ncbi:histidine phosphatase family protein [Cyclobacterium sp. 1_MG-2023]|uniref:SixA phosphatase family protein n=1 Tax=Cyclobacterium sp. 1_MG-2023 TaxID=3062681 RepID=UPI0026E1BA62|nr:histidine phosphatase family protein [Cyclobacterium sp. 1_MG-2023]MDO6437469.1 histidine phosphatase family protein [Cyclobacterium sp. 1_MG-2023]